jgi:uncharacterized protein
MTLDTCAILAIINRKDPTHQTVVAALKKIPPPYLIPTGLLTEIAYLLENRLGATALDAFLDEIRRGGFRLVHDDQDLHRAQVLVKRYANLPLGLADALVVACAERFDGVVLTIDKHFWVVAGEGTIQILP